MKLNPAIDWHFPPDPARPAVTHYKFDPLYRQTEGHLLVVRDHLCSGVDTGSHCHEDFYALYIVRTGRATTIINGHPYIVVPGDVYIMPPGGTHSYHHYRDLITDSLYFRINLFSREELSALRRLKGFWSLLAPSRSKSGDIRTDRRLHLDRDQQLRVDTDVELLRSAYLDGELGRLVARNLFVNLLVRLANWHTATGLAEDSGSNPDFDSPSSRSPDPAHTGEMAELARYCEANFMLPLTVPQLAARVFLTPDHFGRLFMQTVGVPPAAYLRRLRLTRSQELLRESSLDLAQIASESGFSDARHLAHCFKTAFQVTPSQYRATFRRGKY